MINLSLLINISAEELRLVLAEDVSEDGFVLRDLNSTITEEGEVREDSLEARLVRAEPLLSSLGSVLSLLVLDSGSLKSHVDEGA